MSTPGDQDLEPQPQQKSCTRFPALLHLWPESGWGPTADGFTDLASLHSVTLPSAFVWSHLCLVVQITLSPPNPWPSSEPAGSCSSLP